MSKSIWYYKSNSKPKTKVFPTQSIISKSNQTGNVVSLDLTNKLDIYEKSRANGEKTEAQNEIEARLKIEIENLKQKLEESHARNCLLEQENKRTKDANEVI